MISVKLYQTLSRVNKCVSQQSTKLLQKYANSSPFNNPSSCFKPFRTKKSMDIQNLSQAHFKYTDIFTEPFSVKRLKGPIVFTLCTGTCCYVGCSIWSYENYINRGNNFLNDIRREFQDSNYRPDEPKWRKDLRKRWNALHPGDRVYVPILFLNGVVFLAWFYPRLHPVLYKYFASNPQSKYLSVPMLLSTFSHQSPLHIFANMFVLHSFMPSSVEDLGKEQFVGFYLTAGVVASLLSYVHKILVRKPGLSIGASGAIMAVLAHTCITHPDTELGILFVPYVRFSAEHAIQGIMLLDFLGVLFRWRLFDHAAHLGGALFGILYSKYGEQTWAHRAPVVEYWKSLKKQIGGG
ncbi:hypothetical protein M8J76_001708 [Diaphorina citri]|nr:hypothetical protein M8J75_015248 [Diaphorina citri]KAI5713587.1 hypothetical protein M8J76_001708 [Diaphorina citri]